MNESPLAPLLRGICALAVIVLIVMLLAGCVTPPPAPEPVAKAAIPADLALVCYDGWFTIYSEQAGQALRLPIRCKEA